MSGKDLRRKISLTVNRYIGTREDGRELIDEACFNELKDDLVNLFRSWALDIVGEDDEVMYEEIDTGVGVERLEYNSSHNDRVRGYNGAKQEIRKKIEEATK